VLRDVFGFTGYVLVLLQFTVSSKHVVNGAVIQRTKRQVMDHLPIQEEDALPVVLVFGTVEDGIATEQTVQTDKGMNYAHEGSIPRITQYAMMMDDDRYKQLMHICEQGEE
jgi:hypothetical protein